MIAQRNVMNILVGKNLAAYKAGEIDLMADGQIAVVSISNKVDDLGNVLVNKVKIVQKSGDKYLFSPVIDMANVTRATAVEYVAATEQVTYIGYNETAGSIDVFDDNLYSLNIKMRDELAMFAPSPYTKFAYYTSGTGATQKEIADGLYKVLLANFEREPLRSIKFDRVSDGTLTELAADTSVIYNSKVVASAGHGMVAGDIISLRDVVYEVASATTNAFVLDAPYQGVTETIIVGSTVDQAASVATITNWGIKMTGLAKDNFREGVWKYSVVEFDVIAKQFGASTITEAAQANKGIGTYEEVAELEWFLQGNEGSGIRIDTPPVINRKDATMEAGKGYDLITIEFNDGYHETLGNSALSFKQLLIATHSDATGTVHADLKTGLGF